MVLTPPSCTRSASAPASFSMTIWRPNSRAKSSRPTTRTTTSRFDELLGVTAHAAGLWAQAPHAAERHGHTVTIPDPTERLIFGTPHRLG